MNQDMNDKLAQVEDQLHSIQPPDVPDGLLDQLLNNFHDQSSVRVARAWPRTLTNLAAAAVLMLIATPVAWFYSKQALLTRDVTSAQTRINLIRHETNTEFILPHSILGSHSFEPHARQPLVQAANLTSSFAGFEREISAADQSANGNLLSAEKWSCARVSRPGLHMTSQRAAKKQPEKLVLLIENSHEYLRPTSNNWHQSVPDVAAGTLLRLTARIETRGAEAANICLQCWSSDGKMLGFSSTPPLIGNRSQQEFSTHLTVPPGTARVMVRAALTGKGRVSFSELRLTSLPAHMAFVMWQAPAQQAEEATPANDDDNALATWLEKLGTAEDSRFEALNALVRIGRPAVPPLRKLLRDRSQPEVRRWQAAKALGAIGDRSAVEDLLAVLNEQTPQIVQLLAVEALLRFKDDTIRQQLVKWGQEQTDTELKQRLAKMIASRDKPNAPAASQDAQTAADPWKAAYQWASSHQAALSTARQNQRLAMTIVSTHESREPSPMQLLDRAELPFHMLLRGPMTDPDLKALIENYFVLRHERVWVARFLQLGSSAAAAQPESLAELTDNTNLRPLAILIHDGDGQLLYEEDAIGVFNARRLHRMLRIALETGGIAVDERLMVDVPDALPTSLQVAWIDAKRSFLRGETETVLKTLSRAGLTATSDQSPLDQVILGRMRLLAGKALHHAGNKRMAAQQLLAACNDLKAEPAAGEALYWLLNSAETPKNWQAWRALATKFSVNHPSSLWTRKIALLDALSELKVAASESFDIPQTANPWIKENDNQENASQAEASDSLLAARRGLQYLIGSQTLYGDWRPLSGGQFSQSFSQPAITAIAASAIHAWRNDVNFVSRYPELEAPLAKAETAAAGALLRYVALTKRQPTQDYSQIFNQTYALEYFLQLVEERPGNEAAKRASQSLIDALESHQFAEGGWSYLSPENLRWGGPRMHSFNTAPVLLELVRAQKLGLTVAPTSIERGMQSLKKQRSDEGVFAYSDVEGFQWLTAQHSAIARDALCELALKAVEPNDAKSLMQAVNRFDRYREQLDRPRKLFASSFNAAGHGAYFYAFGYFYASRALEHLPDARAQEVASHILADLLAAAESDGTWIDFHAQGKPYATAMVLRAICHAKEITK